jgi:diguanylate cyclase (GGDEF)-like protein
VSDSDILSENARFHLYRLITGAYFFTSVISFGAQYFSKRESLGTSLVFNFVIFMLGFLLYHIQNMKENFADRDFFSDLVLAITIPVMIFNYFEYTAIYVLIIPFIFLLVGICLNQKRMLSLTAGFTFIPLVGIWVIQPNQIVVMSSLDHGIRLMVFVVLFVFAFYINHIYRMRLKENEEQMKMQSFLSQITNLFLMADESNMDKKMDQMLSMCSQRFDMDRIYIIIFSKSRHEKNKVYEWYKEGFEPIRQTLEDTFIRDLPIWIDFEKLKNNKYISFPDVPQMKSSQAKDWLESRNIKSFLLNAMVNKDQVFGLIGIETIHESVTFQKSPTEFLSLLTHLISNVWNKIESEKENNYRANYDTLTGLVNRSSLNRKLDEEIEIASAKHNIIGIIFVDVDSFKTVNDTLGHSGGDALLIQISQRLKKLVRYYDTVSRFGGDEFVIMISDITKEDDIKKIADKILVGFNRPFYINNQSFYITVSLGISIYPTDGDKSEELIRYADMAMYHSKINGKNKYTICSDDMRRQVLLQTELTNDLHHALEHREFVLYYQPQINAKDGRILGFEALIRWKHPTRGFIAPGIFIPLAERTGLINSIGEWVLYEACRQNKAWEAMGYHNLNVAVNLSLAQFLNPNLVNTVRATLIQTKLKPQFLELEITESIAAYDKDSIIKTMNKLKELGVSLSIDDFGVEYSSLSRLDQMPIDKIKIDMKFVHGITSGNKDEGIIQVILQMGRIFGLRVIAEGVENESQLSFLKRNNCDEIQGFYYYKPMTAEDITNLLESYGRKL